MLEPSRHAAPGADAALIESLSRRAYSEIALAASWEEIWEAGPYYDRVSELLEDAHNYAILVGWQIDSRLPLLRPGRPGHPRMHETLKAKAIRLCARNPDFQLYFLIWDHAYLYVIERELWQGRLWEKIHERVHFVFDNRHPLGASHHEKVCLVDGHVALTGGVDLCADRWDSSDHLYRDARRSLDWRAERHGPYHDLAIQVSGPIYSSLHRHVERRWRKLSTIPFPPAPPVVPFERERNAPGHAVFVSRTIVEASRDPAAAITREIEFLFRDLIRLAQRRIIMEGQYYWSEEVNDLLVAKMAEMRGQPFEIFLILSDLEKVKSFTRHMAGYQLELLHRLQLAAATYGTRLIVGTPYVHPPFQAPLQAAEVPPFASQPRAVYIHSKILIIDDQYLSIGSANFAIRALRTDTEINLTLVARTEAERNHIRATAARVLRHWKVMPNDSQSTVHLRQVKPPIDLLRFKLGFSRRAVIGMIPWKLFFDPPLPWFHSLRLRWHRFARDPFRPRHLLWLHAAATVAAYGICILLLPDGDQRPLLFAYVAWLTAVWLRPIPFAFGLLLAAAQLGGTSAAAAGVASIWIASLWLYAATRIFPGPATQFYGLTPLAETEARLAIGIREFEPLVRVLVSPRSSLHSKIAWQGLYCVPLPWFAFATGALLAAMIYAACEATGWALEALLPGTIESIRAHPVTSLCLGALAYLGFRFGWSRRSTWSLCKSGD